MDWVALSQAGPVAILLVIGALLGAAIVKKVLVPGWIYDQEREGRIAAEKREAALIVTITRLTKAAADRAAARAPRGRSGGT